MASMTIKIKDNSAMTIQEMKVSAYMGLFAVGLHLEGEAREELLNDPKRWDTGRLAGSIESEVDGGDLKLFVGTNVEYAGYVHDGTHRMAPNRFLRNAFEHNEDQIKSYLEDALKG